MYINMPYMDSLGLSRQKKHLRTEVISDTEMRCRAPLLFDVFPDAEPPMVPWQARCLHRGKFLGLFSRRHTSSAATMDEG